MKVYTLLLLLIPGLMMTGSGPCAAQPSDGLGMADQYDRNLHMVAVEALVVEVNEERTRDLGIRYSGNQLIDGVDGPGVVEGGDVRLGRPFLNPTRVPVLLKGGGGTNAIGFDSTRMPGLGVSLVGMNVGTGVISARLRALLEVGESVIRSRPIAVALHNTPVRIETINEVPYQNVAHNKNLSVEFDKVGILMEVKPTIENLPQRVVTLNIDKLEVSSVSSFITTQNVDRPVFSRSSTRTSITMTEGETFVIGGLKARRMAKSTDTVPFLGTIPILKWFFSSHNDVERNMDVLFFITPYILAPGQNLLIPFDFKNKAVLDWDSAP
jgi:type II secretory pathway component GspD/PulD (secretin)